MPQDPSMVHKRYSFAKRQCSHSETVPKYRKNDEGVYEEVRIFESMIKFRNIFGHSEEAIKQFSFNIDG